MQSLYCIKHFNRAKLTDTLSADRSHSCIPRTEEQSFLCPYESGETSFSVFITGQIEYAVIRLHL